MTDQLALFEAPDAPVIERPRPWTVCARSEPITPNWYEVQTFHSGGPPEWKLPDGYNRFMIPVYWNGTQWCLSDDNQMPSPKGTTYPGNSNDRWRNLPPDFSPADYKQSRLPKPMPW